MVKLRKLGPGRYATLDGRYQVERQDGLTECEHPLCDTLHRKWHTTQRHGWVHYIPYPAWHVWDNERDDYAGGGGPEEFDTKALAVAWLERHLVKNP